MTVKRNGFTLIELLVVLTIIALLGAVVGPQVMKQLRGAKSKTARMQIEDLGAGLDLFNLENGRYPTTQEGLEALIQAPPGLEHWNGPYLKKSKIPQDPWNNSYHYQSPGDHGPYDLYSYGADNVPGGAKDNADILSWE
jgi:general secretion pathway protein G